MRVINLLPEFLDCLRRWERPPSRAVFEREYLSKVEPWLEPMFEDFSRRSRGGLYSMIGTLDWSSYREETLRLDPAKEEARLVRQMQAVEGCLDAKLEGEAILFGAFTMMDGYARFDLGRHRVFLGVDEFYQRGVYLDVLLSHELTHVIRESREPVWKGWGLSPRMSHDEFTESQPVIEHLFSEGFSCAVSEIIHPGAEPSGYCYQTEQSLRDILANGSALDRGIRRELGHPHEKSDYSRLYDVSRYGRVPTKDGYLPLYAHYAWAWQWVKLLLAEENPADPVAAARALAARCSKEWVDHALAFQMPSKI